MLIQYPAIRLIKIILLVITTTIAISATSQKLDFEQYYFHNSSDASALVGIVGFDTQNQWHTEFRYNYDDYQTVSIYAGKTFKKEAALGYTITPMLGVLQGNTKGISPAVNAEADFKKWYVSTELQYVFSFDDHNADYMFNWSELGYQPLDWFYAGLALQQLMPLKQKKEIKPGILCGFVYKNLTVPVYAFLDHYKNIAFVAEVNLQFPLGKKQVKKIN